jgi:FkbM family methyltransferase
MMSTMNDQTWASKARESAKLAVRSGLYRFNLDVGRDPYAKRLVRTLGARGIDTVLDVGANVGQFAAQLRSAGYTGRVVSFEPLSGAFAELSRRAAGDDRWEVVNAAVGDGGTTATIHVAGNSFSSSLLPMTDKHATAAPGSEPVGTEEVRLVGVPEVVDRFAVEASRTLLKIDTQGYEGQVLDSAGPLVDRLAAIQLELSFVELYAGQPLFDELVRRMQAAGLTLWSLETGFSDQQGRLMQVDGLFVRAD